MMRRFEFVEGSSSKFWEIDQVDTAVTVRYGRIGTAGTAQTKTHADAAIARVEADKLVREKVAKGYVEQGGATTPAPVAAAAPRTAAKRAAPAVDDSANTSADTNAFEPPGVLRLTAAWRKLLPDRREPPSLPDWLAHDRDALLADEPYTGSRWLPYDNKDRVPPLPLLDAAELRGLLTPAALQAASLDDWTRLFATAAQFGIYAKRPELNSRATLNWAVRLCVLWADAATAIGAYLRLFCGPRGDRYMPGIRLSFGDEGFGLADVRAVIAALDAEATARVHERLLAFSATGPLPALVAASLMPRADDLVGAAVDQLANSPYEGSWRLVFDGDLSPARIDKLLAQPQHWIVFTGDQLRAEDATRLGLLAARLSPERAAVAFERLLAVPQPADTRVALARLVRACDNAMAMRLLVKHASRKEMRAQLDEFAQAWPALAIACAAELGDDLDKTGKQWLAGLANGNPDAVAQARERVGDAGRAVLDGLRQRAPVDDAPLAAVPAVLRDPPWLRPRVERVAPAALARYDAPPELVWPPGLEARWRARCGDDVTPYEPWLAKGAKGLALAHWLLAECGLTPDWLARLEAGETPPFEDRVSSSFTVGLLLALPAPAAATLWAWSDPDRFYDYDELTPGLAARYGLVFLPVLLRLVKNAPVEHLPLALPFRAAVLAAPVAHALRHTRRGRAAAQAWLLAHATLASAALMPDALRDDAAGLDAQFALRWLARNGRAAELDDGAARHGDAGRAALAHVLAFDVLSLFPARLPKLPALWTPRSFTRPQLAAGGALPESVLDAFGTMLAFSTPDQPYAGIDAVRAACTPASLAAFAWDLFEAWLAAGAPSKEQWAFAALVPIGGDDAARRLAPLIRAWPGEGGHARAVLGLDVLAGIGSDVALMHLNGIAQKVKFKALQQQARDRIATIADARGLSADELADRLVPDLGLDDDGALSLDFGARAFRVGFDEALKPFVRDASGARLKDLPKPNRTDDAALATAATERYKALKKDARALAALQLQRLERAMIERRRWSAEEFRLFFLGHPLLAHLVRRLLWGAYRDGALVACFRVAEDASFADANDAAYELFDGARVGIVHPLELDAATLAAFGQVFADYEIAQPFAQIGRETRTLTAEESNASELRRFVGRKIATGSALGLESRGWRLGDPQDSGWIGWVTRELPDELDAQLMLDPGTSAGDVRMEPVQHLQTLVLRRRGSWDKQGEVAFGALDAIVASELLRDVDLLAQIP